MVSGACATQRCGLLSLCRRVAASRRPPQCLVPAALRGLDYVGTVALAAGGAMVAGHAGMDILGCAMVGTMAGIGGGTIRDLLLGGRRSLVQGVNICLYA